MTTEASEHNVITKINLATTELEVAAFPKEEHTDS